MSLNLGTAVAILTLDISGFEQGFKGAQSAMEGFNSKGSTVSNKFQSVGNALTSVGGTLTDKVTMPILGLGKQIVQTGSEFEYAMSQVKKTVKSSTGYSEEAFQKLTEEARRMGRDTTFTATEAANALEYMGMAGWGINDMLNGLEPILNLAIAGNTDLATTSDIVTDALTGFGLTSKDTSHFVDILAAASMNSNTNVNLLGESFKYVAPVAGAFKFTAEDTALALGLMANAGIKSSMAGTSLRSVMTNLANPVGQSKAAVEALGIEITNADGSTRSWRSIMDELRAKLGGATMSSEELTARISYLDEQFQSGAISEEEYADQSIALAEAAYAGSDAEKVRLAAMLAGKTGMAGLLAIVNAGQGDYNNLAGAIDGCTDETKGYSAAQDMAKVAQDNFQSKMDILISKLTDLAISLFDLIEGPLTKIVDKIGEVVDWLNSLDDDTKETIIQFALFAAAAGPVLSALGNVLKVVGFVINVFKGLGKIVEIVAGVFGAGGGAAGGTGLLSVLGKLAKFLIGGLVSAIEAFVAAVGAVPAAIIAIVAAIVAIFVILYKKWDKFHDLVNKVAGAIKDFVLDIPENVGKAMKWLGEKTSEMLDDITDFGKKMVEKAKKIGGDFVDKLKDSLGKLRDSVKEKLDKASDKIKEWRESIKDLAKSAAEKFNENVVKPLGELAGKAKKQLDKAVDKAKDFKENFVEYGKLGAKEFNGKFFDVMDKFGEKLGGTMGDGMRVVASFGKEFVGKGDETSKDYVEKFKLGMKNLPNMLSEQFSKAIEGLSGLGSTMVAKGRELIGKFVEGIRSMASTVASAVKSLISAAQNPVETAQNLINKVKNPRAVGVDYVPYNGYGATLHEGEMVLTKQEAEEYRKGNGRTNEDGDTFIFNSPDPIDERKAARLLKQTKRELALGF